MPSIGRRRRKGFAATLASVILFSTLLLASVTVQYYSDISAQMSQLTQLESNVSSTSPLMMASNVLWLIHDFQQDLALHPPANCSTTATADKYLSSIVVTNATVVEDSKNGLGWQVSGVARYYDGANPGGDNLTSLSPSYSGYDKGMVNLAVSTRVRATGVSINYTKEEVHYVHLPVLVSEICAGLALNDGRLGLMVPLYSDPALSTQWTELIVAKLANPFVPVVGIINPDNGPGYAPNHDFGVGVAALHEAGIAVLGYVDTDYGKVPLQEVENETSAYLSWYHADGVFFDDMNASSDSAYYQAATDYAHSLGLNYSMANAGTVPEKLTVANAIVEYEHRGLPASVPSMNSTVGAIIAYSVPQLPPSSWLESLHGDGVGWVWITDESNSYSNLPTYLDQEMSELTSLS
jgi:Spherulation-specific family 4